VACRRSTRLPRSRRSKPIWIKLKTISLRALRRWWWLLGTHTGQDADVLASTGPWDCFHHQCTQPFPVYHASAAAATVHATSSLQHPVYSCLYSWESRHNAHEFTNYNFFFISWRFWNYLYIQCYGLAFASTQALNRSRRSFCSLFLFYIVIMLVLIDNFLMQLREQLFQSRLFFILLQETFRKFIALINASCSSLKPFKWSLNIV